MRVKDEDAHTCTCQCVSHYKEFGTSGRLCGRSLTGSVIVMSHTTQWCRGVSVSSSGKISYFYVQTLDLLSKNVKREEQLTGKCSDHELKACSDFLFQSAGVPRC